MVTSSESYRLSPGQRRVWEQRPAHGARPVAVVLHLSGEIDADRMRRAVAAVAERHSVLHSRYVRVPGLRVPHQVPDAPLEPAWEVLDGDAGAEAALQESASAPFDLELGPVLRAVLARKGSGRWVLALALPELSADATTSYLLADRVLEAYATPLPEAEEVPFGRIAEWQNALLADEGDEEDAWVSRRVWERALSRPVSWSRIPLELPEGSAGEGAAEPVTVELAPPAWSALRRVAEARSLYDHELLLAAWAAFVWRLGDRREAALGCVVPGRSLEILETLLGPLSRQAPVVLPLHVDQTLGEVAEEVQGRLRQIDQHVDYLAPSDPRLPERFPVGFAYERLPSERSSAGWTASCQPWSRWEARFGVELRAVLGEPGVAPRLALGFDPGHHRRADVARYAAAFQALLADAGERPEASIARLSLGLGAGSGEGGPVLSGCAPRGALDGPIHRLVSRWAERRPDQPAVAAGGLEVSYRRLEEESNRLARHLVRQGVGPETPVGLCVGRTPELVLTLVAVLKAGGCYVPLDPRLPRARRELMVRHAGIRVIVAGEGSEEWQAGTARVVRLDADRDAWSAEPAEGPEVEVDPDNLAYVLFTSGSTGVPKAVAVSHRQLSGHVAGLLETLGVAEAETFAMVSSFGADLGNTSLYGALATGGTVLIANEEEAGDPVALARCFRRRPVSVLKIVPSHLRALLAGSPDRELLPGRWLVLGGEALDWELVRRVAAAAPGCRVINEYGPTEATVGAVAWTVDPEAAPAWAVTVPIGTPLPGYRAVVADPDLQPVPMGVLGELLLGGVGLARGYLGRPAETAKHFVPDPYGEERGGRLYRTGDSVRRLPGDLVEFVGRIDDQVKIRGFRVEPREVAAAITDHPGVQDAAVVVHDDGAGRLHLLAGVVPGRGGGLDPEELQEFLAHRLPEHMLPARVAVLAKLPLTPNGKVDRTALAASEAFQDRSSVSLVEPRDDAEATLAEVWRQVLRLDRVSVHDNFFRLGGDSILGIQVIARANQAGLRLTPRQIFELQTIAELAAAAGTAGPAVDEEGPLAGPVSLLPIQLWFFDRDVHDRHHWNQAVALRCRRRLHPAAVAEALRALLEAHDALRLRFERHGSSWHQTCAPAGEASPLLQIDLSALDGEREAAGFAAAAQALQRSLDLSRGPLLRAALFDRGPARPQKLLLVIHHLVVDGVSWHVLLPDLALALEQLEAGEPVRLPPRTTSIRRWVEILGDRARSRDVAAEIEEWVAMGRRRVQPLPVDRPDGSDAEGHAASLPVALGRERTEALLRDAPGAYGTRIDDLLLAALVRALARWTDSPRHRIELESHGRNEADDGLDLSRTVGWLTARYPVVLEARGPGVADLVKGIKEQLNAVRPRGLHYGLLRYMAGPEAAESLASLPDAEVSYNYFGQLDAAIPPAAPFEPAPDGVGDLRSPLSPQLQAIQVTAWIAEGRLHVRFKYGSRRHRESTMRALADDFLAGLEELIDHCAARKRVEYTPSDFPFAQVGQEDLDRIVGQIEGASAGGLS